MACMLHPLLEMGISSPHSLQQHLPEPAGGRHESAQRIAWCARCQHHRVRLSCLRSSSLHSSLWVIRHMLQGVREQSACPLLMAGHLLLQQQQRLHRQGLCVLTATSGPLPCNDLASKPHLCFRDAGVMPLARRSWRDCVIGGWAEWEPIVFASIHMGRTGAVADNPRSSA